MIIITKLIVIIITTAITATTTIIIIIIIITITNAYISILPISPRSLQRAHISPEEDWNFRGKIC